MERTKLNESKLTDRFLKDVVHTIVHILNRAQLRPNSWKTPYDLWTWRKASSSHFRVFGSKCYIKCEDEKLGKFDARSNEVTLLDIYQEARLINAIIWGCIELWKAYM